MSAEKSIGTTLTKVKSGEEATDLLIANLTSIGEVGISSDEIDVTTLDSSGGYKEFIAGAKDAGEVAIAGFVKDETNMSKMFALAESQAIESWIIETVSGSKLEFDGFVKSFKESESKPDGVRGFSGSIRISGPVTYTPASEPSA